MTRELNCSSVCGGGSGSGGGGGGDFGLSPHSPPCVNGSKELLIAPRDDGFLSTSTETSTDTDIETCSDYRDHDYLMLLCVSDTE
jgi:hypothetical protein